MTKDQNSFPLSLSTGNRTLLLIISFVVVAFGQPLWSSLLSILSAAVGYAFFCRVLLSIPEAKKRFFIGMGWFAAVQFIQFSWVLSHPYFYIYFILLLVSALFGAQWGLIALLIKPESFKNVSMLLALAGFWTLLEWSRLFLFSGLPFNPVGLALSDQVYSLQFASIVGILGLSFWVILTNFLLLRAWIQPRSEFKWAIALTVLLFPYFFGWEHLAYHEKSMVESKPLAVVLVQPALPVLEPAIFRTADEFRSSLKNKWRQILSTLKHQVGRRPDFIVLPEYVVPYGTFHLIYPQNEIHELFQSIFGDVSGAYPVDNPLYSDLIWSDGSAQIFVSNGYVIQTLVNLFKTDVLVGLEDSLDEENGEGRKSKVETYAAAFHFKQGSEAPLRYDKRILVPMGEYIPFDWCRNLAARYGVSGSFTPGEKVGVFKGKVPFGLSICYEELFSGLTRQNRIEGAELLINLTNDGWFPNSNLPKQHFDHARLRTVENGIPLVRSCNTGITGAFNSLGQVVGILTNETQSNEAKPGSIYLEVPSYHYQTFYSLFGDLPVLLIGAFFICLVPFFKNGS